MIEAVDLRFGYPPGDVAVLEAVSLRAEVGEIVAVVGLSGCGKSTLLRVLSGLDRPWSGLVRSAPCALMPQGDALLPWRSALANSLVAARLDRRPIREATAEAAALFRRFGLAGAEAAYPHTLSGGMRRRVALLRTFLSGRSVLLLDEPFGALDAPTRDDLARWLQAVLAALPRAVVLVTHDLDEAVALATRILVLGGRPARVQLVVQPATLGADSARQAVLEALRPGALAER